MDAQREEAPNMATCDVCNRETTFVEGTVYTANEFRQLAARGFEPGNDSMGVATALGISRSAFMAQWRQTVARDTTDWLLCPRCAARAATYMPAKRSASGSGGGLDALKEALGASMSPADRAVAEDMGTRAAARYLDSLRSGSAPTPAQRAFHSAVSAAVSNAAAKPKTSGWAKASLISSIIPLLLPIGSILGIIFGFVALGQIKRSSSSLAGQGLAISGIVIGAVVLVLSIGAVAFLVANPQLLQSQ
jgi:hypothetical protein